MQLYNKKGLKHVHEFIHKEIIKIVGEIGNTATSPIITINFLHQFLMYSCLTKKKTRQRGAGFSEEVL